MSLPVTVRLPEPSADQLRQIARRERRSVSEVGARLIEEGLRQSRFPYIEFRSFGGERHACLKGRLQAWQVIMVAQDYGMDVESVARHLHLTSEQVEAVFSYYRTYPEEIDCAVEDNAAMTYERAKQLLPSIHLVELPRDVSGGEL
jgi:hypothetical protein